MGPSGPDEGLIQDLKIKAEGLFIWIATVFSYLRSAYNPKSKLSALLLKSIPYGIFNINKKMDALYTAILEACGNWYDVEFQRDYQLVMGAIMAAKRPLSLAALRALCDDIPALTPDLLLERFGSVLVGFRNDHESIRILHISFREFITDRAAETAETRKFFISEKEHSQRFAVRCLRAIVREFKVARISGTGYLDRDDEDPPGIPEVHGVSDHLLYGCEFWPEHIADIRNPSLIVTHVQSFLSYDQPLCIEIVASKGVFRGSLAIWRWLKVSIW